VNTPPPPKVELPAEYRQEQPKQTVVKPTPTPNAPISSSDTAALQRARASRKGNGPSSLVLSSVKSRRDQNGGTAGGLITRTTLLGR
jgi:hypothetical protein